MEIRCGQTVFYRSIPYQSTAYQLWHGVGVAHFPSFLQSLGGLIIFVLWKIKTTMISYAKKMSCTCEKEISCPLRWRHVKHFVVSFISEFKTQHVGTINQDGSCLVFNNIDAVSWDLVLSRIWLLLNPHRAQLGGRTLCDLVLNNITNTHLNDMFDYSAL